MTEAKKTKILVVDDEPSNIRLLEAMLHRQGYTTVAAASGEQALQAMEKDPPDLVLLDIMMPGMSGFQVAQKLKSNPRTSPIPIIMVTSLDDRESRLSALQLGAEEFLSKPVDRAELWARVRNLLRLKEFNDFLVDHARILDRQVKERTARLRESYRETIFTLARAAEFRDEDTGSHIKRISYYTSEIAAALGMEREFTDAIFYASPMHDVGKIGVPDYILLKPGSLSPGEWDIMKCHSAFGAKILEEGTSPYLQMGAEIALTHHERWDGSGYPSGLKGEAIPFSGRIMNICDQYDALRSKRPYKPALDHETAVKIITEGDDRTRVEHFDPAVHAAFSRCTEKFREIFAEHAD